MSEIPYDWTFRPPAPVAEVIVFHPTETSSQRTLRGKLDTGADVTVIPEMLVDQLGLMPQGFAWMRSFDGTYSRRPLYYVRFLIDGVDLRAVRCAASDRRDVLVGRNVLNRFVTTLDGGRLIFSMEPTG